MVTSIPEKLERTRTSARSSWTVALSIRILFSSSFTSAAKDSSTRFAFALGGGVDLRISKRISARVFQMDYIPMLGKDRRVIASDGTVVGINGRARQGDFRLSAGIVFR
jgi:opacity protein-like surface antigen